MNELPVVIPSPIPEEQLGDISVGELDDSMESVVSATARRQALRRQIQEAQENLEQLRLREEDENFFDEGDAAQMAAFRQSLISAKRARETDGVSPVQPLALVDVSRHANPPVPVVQTALFNMQTAVVLERMIDTPLAEKFREFEVVNEIIDFNRCFCASRPAEQVTDQLRSCLFLRLKSVILVHLRFQLYCKKNMFNMFCVYVIGGRAPRLCCG